MRDFSWTYFTRTGDVESFLLYKEVDQLREASQAAFSAAAEAADEPGEAESSAMF